MRYTLSVILIAAVLAIATGFINGEQLTRFAHKLKGDETAQGAVDIGGPFTMTNQDGVTVTEKDLLGHYSLVNFGFTSCPDICPTTLAYMANLYHQLPADKQAKLKMYFVTVDPERDTPEHMKTYLNAWPNMFTGLVGTPEGLAAMAKEYLVYYAKKPQGEGEDYTMDHSSYIYVMVPDGKYVSHFGHNTPPQEALQALLQLLS
jgi:protein SCO1/2